MLNKLRLTFILLFSTLWLTGSSPIESPPPDYRFPLSLNPILLSGTFGELRSNHFHSGIDVKTNGEVGKPLYAARDGYVYRIKVSPWGFGKAIYLRHEDGSFTVYAHMDGFTPDIEDFVYRKQYASKQYEQELYLAEGRMPIRRGELIGYSGNSGSSQGPHLHYEVRDPEERIMNPLVYYKGRVEDHIRPIIQEVAFEPMDAGSRVQGVATKYVLNPDGRDGSYRIPQVIEVSGRVGMEYRAYDLLDGAGNHCGINYARLYLDDSLIFEFALEKFAFDEKRYINRHFDYGFWQRDGRKFEKAYLDLGNKLPAYQNLRNRGLIELADDRLHDLRLELADGYRNTSVIRGQIRRRKSPAPLPESLSFRGSPRLRSFTRRNTAVITVENPQTRHLEGLEVRYADSLTSVLKPAYLDGDKLVYLLPLGMYRLPETVTDPVTGQRQVFQFRRTLLPNKSNIVDYGDLQVYFPYGCIFDTLQLQVRMTPGDRNMHSKVYEIGDDETPLFSPIVLNFKPDGGDIRHLVVARQRSNGSWSFVGNDKKDDGSVYASSNEFGTFCLMSDSVPPYMRPIDFSNGGSISGSQRGLTLRISDNFSGVDSRRIMATLDGNWILMEYDAKSGTIRHTFKDRPEAGRHKLEVWLYDSANNMRHEQFSLLFR